MSKSDIQVLSVYKKEASTPFGLACESILRMLHDPTPLQPPITMTQGMWGMI